MVSMRQRILVVDDDPSLSEMLTIVLRNEGFDTAVIADGSQALTAVRELQAEGRAVTHANLRWLNPLPPDLAALLLRFKVVLVPEINNGQLVKVLRAAYALDIQQYNRISGQPLTVAELREAIVEVLPH